MLQVKEKEHLRLAATAQLARIETERKAEEARKHREAEEQERKRQEEESARMESPEYCIERGLALPPAAFIEVMRDVTFQSDSGNDIADREENRRRWNRFRGKKIVVEGQIRKVEETFFTDKVKCIINAHGKTIPARFDSMSKREGASLAVGETITIEGDLSECPVLSDIAMDHCVIK